MISDIQSAKVVAQERGMEASLHGPVWFQAADKPMPELQASKTVGAAVACAFYFALRDLKIELID